MFKLLLERHLSDTKLGIIGDLSLFKGDSLVYKCNTCENYEIGPARNLDLAIPYGFYTISTHLSGKFSWDYKGVKIAKMPLISNEVVPMERYILIHAGNSHRDTSGCILVGQYKKGYFINSRDTLNKLLSEFYNEKCGEFFKTSLEVVNGKL